MKAYLLKWQQKNRTWQYVDGSLQGQNVSFTMTEVIHKLLRKVSALHARRALHEGCYLVVSDTLHPNTYQFTKEREDKHGSLYSNEEYGNGWLESKITDTDEIYLGVHR